MAEKTISIKDWKLLSKFFRYFGPHRAWVWLSAAIIPLITAGGIYFLWLLQHIIDEFLLPKNADGLVFWVSVLAGVLAANYFLDALYNYALQKAGNYAIFDLRNELAAKALRLPLSYYDKNPVGITLSRLTSDMEALGESFASGVMGMVADIIKTLALLVYLFILDWQLTLVTLLAAPPIFLVVRYLRGRMRDAYLTSRRSLASSTGYLQECLNGMKTIRLYNAEKETFDKYASLNQEFCRSQNKTNIYDASMFSIVEGITSIAVALVLLSGAWQIQAQGLSVGVLIVFVSSLSKLFVPVKQFTQQVATIQRSLAAFEHISELMDQKAELDGQLPSQLPGDFALESIVFEDVRFRYTPDGPYILKGVSFALRKGEQLALVGSTGSGKSTVVRVLTQAYQGYEGSIRVNGIELRTIPKRELNRVVALMQQDVFLFNESLGFNIGLDRAGIDQAQIEAAAQFVYADGFIRQLEGGYDFRVRENGGNLSKGQAQLVSFARSLCGGSELVVLDEATSAVDSVTEDLVQKAIAHIFQKKTVIAIAHRLSTIEHSDQILVMDQGQIVERGTHNQLLEQGGVYARLVSELSSVAQN